MLASHSQKENIIEIYIPPHIFAFNSNELSLPAASLTLHVAEEEAKKCCKKKEKKGKVVAGESGEVFVFFLLFFFCDFDVNGKKRKSVLAMAM